MSVFELGEALHVDPLDFAHATSTVSGKCLALSIAGLRLHQQLSNPMVVVSLLCVLIAIFWMLSGSHLSTPALGVSLHCQETLYV